MSRKKTAKKTAGQSATAAKKQELFVKYYLMTFNATEAAIKAGYSEKTATAQGARLLTNVKVEKLINDEMARLRERMAEEANRIYAALWRQIDEMTERINAHYAAEKAIKSLNKDKHALLFGSDLDSEEQLAEPPRGLQLDHIAIEDLKKQFREINFKLEQAALDLFQREQNFFRAQELRAKLLHDLFDRAGYKPTDKIDLDHTVNGALSLDYMSDEELIKEAAKLDG